MKVIVGTGHRPDKLEKPHLRRYSPEQFERLVALAAKVIDTTDPMEVVSGGALGWDMALAVAAVRMQRPLHLMLPFRHQAARWPEKSQELHADLIRKADRVTIVTNLPPDAPYGRVAKALHDRNTAMLDHALEHHPDAAVVALYNGDPKGGTAHCVREATKRGLTIKNYWESWRRYA